LGILPSLESRVDGPYGPLWVHNANGGLEPPTGFPTTPSRSCCLSWTGSRAYFHLQPHSVQRPNRPPERLRLHVRVGLHRQPSMCPASSLTANLPYLAFPSPPSDNDRCSSSEAFQVRSEYGSTSRNGGSLVRITRCRKGKSIPASIRQGEGLGTISYPKCTSSEGMAIIRT